VFLWISDWINQEWSRDRKKASSANVKSWELPKDGTSEPTALGAGPTAPSDAKE
jgi:hypothetical protein